jgi:hypothetical protein
VVPPLPGTPGSPAFNAELPGSGWWVAVGPPFCASGPRSGETPSTLPVGSPLTVHGISRRLCPPDGRVPKQSGELLAKLPPTMLFRTTRGPGVPGLKKRPPP